MYQPAEGHRFEPCNFHHGDSTHFCGCFSFFSSRYPVHARRVSATPLLGGRPFLGIRSLVHTSCVSDTPFPGWGFRRLRAAGEQRSRAGPKRVDNLRFSTLLGSSPFPFWGYLGATERKRSYLEVGPKKGTAVPLPAHRLGLTPTIPPSATLKPLELCDSIYAKPVQSAAITPRQRGKREPIPVPLYELPTK